MKGKQLNEKEWAAMRWDARVAAINRGLPGEREQASLSDSTRRVFGDLRFLVDTIASLFAFVQEQGMERLYETWRKKP